MDTTPIVEPFDEFSLPAGPRRSIPPSLSARYEDITLLGEGGMGIVYRGRDPRLNRSVALKLIKGDDPALWQRFLQEAKAQARIQHARVCHVYETGRADGEPYIAMQYIDGEPLSRLHQQLTLEQNVKIIQEISLAVHEAHRLGMIHRDIKPGNILVEKQEDGSLDPYIMDFGLARQVEERGQTMSGAIVGTPAYMSPEQANGEIRAMDRRSDVYSLGATLYHIIAGRPPFVANMQWQLLLEVGYDEALRLGKIKKGVPVDLETIVMKCLEREPGRRYDSAKALAEDLQRFLDGDAILAKRSSFGYVLWKKASKHKLIVALGIFALLAVTIPLTIWIQSRRQIAAQMELSRTLGEDVKSTELYLRAVYELPLHDVEKERAMIRERLADIEKNMLTLGHVGEGPGHYAIGRGQLALGDFEKARMHLERALATGYAPPELHYALGRVLGELYRRGLEESKRLAEERRKANVIELEKRLRDPALEHLRAAAGRVESPAHVEGLIAFYEGRYDEALEKARKAFVEVPLMYEAKKLEGDILFAQGSQYRHDAAFDYEKMMTYFKPAADAYATAANIGRSDSDVYLAECELRSHMMLSDIAQGIDELPNFRAADEACLRAMEARSTDGRARIQRGFFFAIRAAYQANASAKDDGRIPELITQSIHVAEDARRQSPENAMAHYVVGLSYSADIKYRFAREVDATTSMMRAIDAFSNAIRLDPQFAWAFQDGSHLLGYKIVIDAWYGRDPTLDLAEAMKYCNGALALDPRSFFTILGQGLIHVEAARAYVERGESPREQFLLAKAAYDKAKELSPNHWLAYNNSAEMYTVLAQYQMLVGEDPTDALAKAWLDIERAKKLHDTGALIETTVGEFHLVKATYDLHQERDPTSSIVAAREAHRIVNKESQWDVNNAARQTDIETIAIRWAMKRNEATEAMFDAAFAPLPPLLSNEIVDPYIHLSLAGVHALRAKWLVAAKKDPKQDIEKGLALTDRALALNSHNGRAFALKGELLLVRAKAAMGAPEKLEAAKAAKEALTRAFKEMPLLEREFGNDAAETARMIE